ncbi:MAG: hypothetical protein OXR67_01870 [Chloroflexota bacterium]|nr:hypothetical protein [Chloroflexota bacterium]MDE2937656.1 hypothetical protein [Chloroflexota bacterium]
MRVRTRENNQGQYDEKGSPPAELGQEDPAATGTEIASPVRAVFQPLRGPAHHVISHHPTKTVTASRNTSTATAMPIRAAQRLAT